MRVEFSGGLETLFDNQKALDLDAPEGENMLWLLDELASRITGDEGLFLQEGTLRPGILALINDTDWEILDQEEYILQPNDTIHFASTLHGG